jgi:hypothetical protein
MRRLSPVSAWQARTNGVAWRTGYARDVSDDRRSSSGVRRLALLVVLAACRNPEVDHLTAIRDKVCACKTPACAEQELKAVPDRPIKSTRLTQTIARDMLDCMARLQNAERPDSDPDAESADSDGDPAAVSAPRIVAPASARKP